MAIDNAWFRMQLCTDANRTTVESEGDTTLVIGDP
jgi:hypothetical protein